MDVQTIERHVKDAILQFAGRSLAAIMNGDLPGGYGSATAIQYRGNCFLVTAAHNLAGSVDHIRFVDSENVEQPIEVVMSDSMPKRVGQTLGAALKIVEVRYDRSTDVAFLHVEESDLRERLHLEPVSQELISHEITPGTWGMIHGYPNAHARTTTSNARITGIDYAKKTVRETIDIEKTIRHVGLPAMFDDAEDYRSLTFDRPFCDYEIFFLRDDSRPFTEFPGYSGGGIWSLEPLPVLSSELFSPEHCCKLVGIQTNASDDTRTKHFVRGTRIMACLKIIDDYLDGLAE